jgi:ubiquinone biosynthesis protein UbiJ
LFRTLAIIIIVYYVLRWLAKIFAPILMKRMVNKMQQKAQQQQQQYNQHRQNTTQAREGETIIDKKPNTPKQSSDDVGEYVDFEEID